MTPYDKITALYSRLSVGDEDRDGGESNSIVNQKAFLERYARQKKLLNIRHYIDDDESGRFFDRSGYVQMMNDVESGKIGIVIMKDMTRWGRDYLQVGNAMEVFRKHNVRFIAINNGIDSIDQNTLEFAPFINIMFEWYARDISKKVKTGIRTKGATGKPRAGKSTRKNVLLRNTGAERSFMKTGLKKSEKTTEIYFDEASSVIEIHTHNTDLKNRLTAYAGRFPDLCKLIDEDTEQGYKEFIICKGRFCFRLTAPYSEERRTAASKAAKIIGICTNASGKVDFQ